MKTFALNQEPNSIQLSIRISNLISAYGSQKVREAIEASVSHELLRQGGSLNQQFDNVEKKFVFSELLYVNTTQVVRYFGPAFVRNYWNQIYSSKVA